MVLYNYQQELYNLFTKKSFRVAVGIWPRQSGKSLLENKIIIDTSIKKKSNIIGFYWAPFLAGDHYLNKYYHDFGFGNELVKESRQWVELRNGSSIHSTSYLADRVKGINWDLIVVDEFFYAPEKLIYEVIHYLQIMPKVKILFMGTKQTERMENFKIIQTQLRLWEYFVHLK